MKRNRINTPRTRGKSPYHKYGKVPYKYPFATGAAYAKAREFGHVAEPVWDLTRQEALLQLRD